MNANKLKRRNNLSNLQRKDYKKKRIMENGYQKLLRCDAASSKCHNFVKICMKGASEKIDRKRLQAVNRFSESGQYSCELLFITILNKLQIFNF